jgi:hypothetical protein
MAGPDSTDLLYVFDASQVCVWTGVVFTEDGVAPAVFQLLSFRQTDLLVLCCRVLTLVLSGGLPVLAKPGDKSVGLFGEQPLAQWSAPSV